MPMQLSLSLSLDCDKAKNDTLLEGIDCYFCTLNTKLVRTDNGDIAFSASDNLKGCGLSEQQAIFHNMNDNLRKLIKINAEKVKKEWNSKSGWNLDLIVTGVQMRSDVENISHEISRMSGVRQSAISFFRKEMSVISVSGVKAANLEKFAMQIEKEGTLNLKIEYESDSVIHVSGGLPEQFPESRKIVVQNFNVNNIFPSYQSYYRRRGVGTISLKNITKKKLLDVVITFKIDGKTAGVLKLSELTPGKSIESETKLDAIPERVAGRYSMLSAEIEYRSGGKFEKLSAHTPVILHNRNAIDWSKPESIGSFIDIENEALAKLSSKALSNVSKRPEDLFTTPELWKASSIYTSIWNDSLKYVKDPVITSFDSGIDTVQYPGQTLERLAGDCDDLTVLMSSLMESAGLATAVVVVPGHLLTAIDSGTLAGGHLLFGIDRSMFIEIDGALFIPVETTAPGISFADAWIRGAEVVAKSNGNITYFRTREILKNYSPAFSESFTNNLKAEKIDHEKVSNSLKGALDTKRDSLPDWVSTVQSAVLSPGVKSGAELQVEKEYILVPSILEWARGNVENGVKMAGALCRKNIAEACYNMTFMQLAKSSQGTENDKLFEKDKDTYVKAVSFLPREVIFMLIDNLDSAYSAEIYKEAVVKKKLVLFLKSAQKKIEPHKIAKKKGKSKDKEVSLLQGRKGAAREDKSALFLFFWDRIIKRD